MRLCLICLGDIRDKSAQTLRDPCNPNGNATGVDRCATSSPPFGLIKPLRRTLLPERSKRCKSHGSNQWLTAKIELEGRESDLELHGLPRYAPEYNPDEFLNNDLKQELANEPMPESTSGLRCNDVSETAI